MAKKFKQQEPTRTGFYEMRCYDGDWSHLETLTVEIIADPSGSLWYVDTESVREKRVIVHGLNDDTEDVFHLWRLTKKPAGHIRSWEIPDYGYNGSKAGPATIEIDF